MPDALWKVTSTTGGDETIHGDFETRPEAFDALAGQLLRDYAASRERGNNLQAFALQHLLLTLAMSPVEAVTYALGRS